MKIIRRILICAMVVFTSPFSVHAQSSGTNNDDLTALLQAVEELTPTNAASLPVTGTFWSAQHAPGTTNAWPPLPGDFLGLDAWPLGDGVYLIDDVNVDYDALAAENEAASASPMMRMSMMSSSLATSYAYGNAVYLTNMAAFPDASGNTIASFSIAGGTNFVPYDILTDTNLTDSIPQWTWLGIGYTSNSYTFSNQPADQAFYILAKPTKTTVVGWGDDSYSQCDVPSGLTNALEVAGGLGQSLALLNDGSMVAWSTNDFGEGSVPTNITGAAMIAAGWYHDVALLTNGTVVAWGAYVPFFGWTMTNVPPDLTNATVISAQALHTLALRSD